VGLQHSWGTHAVLYTTKPPTLPTACGRWHPHNTSIAQTTKLKRQHVSPACLDHLLFKQLLQRLVLLHRLLLLLLCDRETAHAAPACFAFSTSNSYRLMISS
jgi:hypothetical protein